MEFQPVGYQFHQYLRCLTTGLSAAVVTDAEETVSSEDEDSDYVAYLDPSQWKVISMFNNHFIISIRWVCHRAQICVGCLDFTDCGFPVKLWASLVTLYTLDSDRGGRYQIFCVDTDTK